MGFIFDEVMSIWSKEEDGSMILKDETKKWILNIIKRGWKCRLTFTDGSKVVGIPTEFLNNIELTLRSADILDDEDKIIGTYSLEKVKTIEIVENELSNSVLH